MDLSSALSLLAPLLHFFQQHEWLPAIALVSSYSVMLLDGDSRFPISLPRVWNENRWKPVVVLVVSVFQAGVLAVSNGMSPGEALALGFKAAFFSFGLWAVVVKAIYGGAVPKWLLWVSMALPKPRPFDPTTPIVLGDRVGLQQGSANAIVVEKVEEKTLPSIPSPVPASPVLDPGEKSPVVPVTTTVPPTKE